MSFDPRSAYATDYLLIEDVLDAELTEQGVSPASTFSVKVKPAADPPGTLHTGRVGLAVGETALFLWLAGSSAPHPKVGDTVTYNRPVLSGFSLDVDVTITRVEFEGIEPFYITVSDKLANT